MAAQVIHGAMAQLFLEADGAPWEYTTWKEITGISSGLFPVEDAELPKGWTRDIANLVLSFFNQLRKLTTQEDKITFSTARKNASQIPGRLHWRNFITDGWKKWDMHSRIAAVLVEEGLHPLTDPLSDLHLAVDPVAKALFGDKALDQRYHVPPSLHRPVQDIIRRTHKNLVNQIERSKAHIGVLERDAVSAYKGLCCVFFYCYIMLTIF